MLNIFIGYDEHEIVAYHVCAHSILSRSSVPVAITPLNKKHFSGFFKRPRGPLDSTDFSITRFLVPFLSNYEGFSIFMDGDMLVLGDIAELTGYMTIFHHYNVAVRCVKHDYEPKEKRKFLNQPQTKYKMKNWSSVMLFNNGLCRTLTPEYVENADGLYLHQFQWLKGYQMGELPKVWNWLVDEPGYETIPESVRLLHYTKGTPCFPEYRDCGGADLWEKERKRMLSSG